MSAKFELLGPCRIRAKKRGKRIAAPSASERGSERGGRRNTHPHHTPIHGAYTEQHFHSTKRKREDVWVGVCVREKGKGVCRNWV